MSLDEKYVYVIIRQDLPLAIQLGQSLHAQDVMLRNGNIKGFGIPSIIVIGVPDAKRLRKFELLCKQFQVPFHPYADPDYVDLGMTAIATEPLTDAQRCVFSNYRLWNEKNNVKVEIETWKQRFGPALHSA